MGSKALLMALAYACGQQPASAATISNGYLIEDFGTVDYADLTNTTGVWNIVDGVAQAAVVANNSTTRALSFGDGTLGSVTSSTGYTFNTDAYPNGFNFINLAITGGTITVTGSQPLVIRALGTISISSTISVSGGSGSAGVANATNTGSSGGSAVTCSAAGGTGGTATSTTVGNGTSGSNSDGTSDAGATGGTGNTGANGGVGLSGINGPPSNDFDTAANFICGSGAGGGGGSRTGVTYAVGAGGGAGGGRMRLTALGTVTLGATTATGGTGGGGVSNGTNCSGDGGGGNGGAIWIQTFKTISTGSNPDVTAGNSGGSCSVAVGGLSGFRRGDSSAVGTRPAWAGGAGNYDTANAAASQTYYVYSNTYDLRTFNAQFSTSPTITQTLNGGTITVEYATSERGTTFTSWNSNLLSLTNLGHRYLKFKITIVTAGVAGASPTIDQISIPYTDIGADTASFTLGLACGSLSLGESIGWLGLLITLWSLRVFGANAHKRRRQRV